MTDMKPLITQCLVVGILLLFIGTAIMPSIGQRIDKSSLLASKNHWLYVGGTGPGNYTKIQDAIDNASARDTIYVYPGIYYENLWVNKTLTLIGENQTRTIVDTRHATGLIVAADQSSISGFTFQNTTTALVWLSANGSTISHTIFYIRYTGQERLGGLALIGNYNRISNNSFLLYSPSSYGIYLEGQGNLIDHNLIRGCYEGIQDTAGSTNNVIRDCLFEYNDNDIYLFGSHQQLVNNIVTATNMYGIHMFYARNVLLQGNTISHTRYTAVVLYGCENITFIGNNFSFSGETGLDISHSFQCTISQNNFIENGDNAYVYTYLFDLLLSFFKKNIWSHNFWSDRDPTKRWYRVHTDLELLIVWESAITVPWFTFDRSPAREPYRIP